MHRPDTFYGLTKTFTEDLASLYWDKFGIESVMLRICSCFDEPVGPAHALVLAVLADCVRLVEAALTAPRVGFSVIYGTSDNAAAAVSNAHAGHIGFRPQDSADGFAAAVLARTERPDPAAVATRVVGGGFAATGAPGRLTRDAPLRGARRHLAAPPRSGRLGAVDAAARRRRRQPGLGGDPRRPAGDIAAAEAVMRGWGQRAALHDPPRRGGARRGARGARLRRSRPRR